MLNFCKHIDTYSVEKSDMQYWRNTDNSRPSLIQEFNQSRVQIQHEYSVVSLDVLLGLVGGLSAVVFGALNVVLGSYQ